LLAAERLELALASSWQEIESLHALELELRFSEQ